MTDEERTYALRMTETQRMHVITALEACRIQGYLGADEKQRKEIDHLLSMFDNMFSSDETDYTLVHRFDL
ncbi:hypothetical protein ACP46_gp65 [Rhizobium phage RHEph06]|uniref:Uncharacterized protein n=4 Tax=Kleczkowskavirus RHEph4 TaxID=1921526 RepID=A0A7S5USK8_9CAUD|nr:hypothetical protein ACP46_gp65 [Rhizobium phage RHEph06]YP_009598506.1 hypothetical protein FDH25_gp64 [Rhizobium phage RHEph04]AGC35826.1 hypothetical protein RHEph05_gp059 [Rhizobium phage RHEph05]QIG67689.1 hypothetical protein EVB51_072 [Rhizobium phage RHph_Y17]QIG69008.1 hypothetical protein EVB73_072 [Rhizobium phage RHph_Y3_43]QIG69557.1 hypothetical protein EVB80_074 [Rhizobium phage RHph_I36]QIG75431.1 hypothetical protein EVC17_074 [Rhizobium phage RHph_Y1_1]QIG75981.1 hypothe